MFLLCVLYLLVGVIPYACLHTQIHIWSYLELNCALKYLCYTILYDTILYYNILHYTILYYIILYYTILYYIILYYTYLWGSNHMLVSICLFAHTNTYLELSGAKLRIQLFMPNYTIIYYTILYYTILYCYFTILYNTILYHIILYYTILYLLVGMLVCTDKYISGAIWS